ncbi:hypothetical protein BGZ83_003875 [Gryganskiella cystojenkinii]|nr:hypothetical protein BGZ83_003875 [Gryganskiella cystojenkinii]
MARPPAKDQGPGRRTGTSRGRGRGTLTLNGNNPASAAPSSSIAQVESQALSAQQGTRRDIATVGSSSSMQPSHGNNNDRMEPFSNFSQAYNEGYSIPTAMFNTAAFGDVNLATAGTATATTATARTVREFTDSRSHPPSHLRPPPRLNGNLNHHHPSQGYVSEDDVMDEDFDLPADFDEDGFDIDIKTEEVAPDSTLARSMLIPQPVPLVPDSQLTDENQTLKQRLAEMEMKLLQSQKELRAKEEQLGTKTGEAAVHKANLLSANADREAMQKRIRDVEERRKQEVETLEKQYRKEIDNLGLSHQFEVQGLLVKNSTRAKPAKAVQQPLKSSQVVPFKQPAVVMAPPSSTSPEFPNLNFGVSQSQSMVRAPIKKEEESVTLIRSSSSSSSRRSAPAHGLPVALGDKPRSQVASTNPPNLAIGFGQSRPTTYTNVKFKAKLPRVSLKKELIRDKLLKGSSSEFGLNMLMQLESDEGNEAPLPGTVKFGNNLHLDKLRHICVQSLLKLTVDTNAECTKQALSSTTELLKESILRNKPSHTVNSFRILRVLYSSFESISEVIRLGTVPFLEPSCSDPLNVASTVCKEGGSELPSALACIYYLFITRTALELSAYLPEGDTHTSGGLDDDDSQTVKKVDHISPGAWKFSDDASKQLETDIFNILDLVVRDQIKTNNVSHLVTLVHWGVLGNILTRYHSSRHHGDNTKSGMHERLGANDLLNKKSDNRKDWLDVLNKTLNIMDLITQDERCCRSLCGWSVSQGNWKQNFSFEQVSALAELLEIKPANYTQMTDGLLPRLQIKTVEILSRVVRVEYEQTKKMVFSTKLGRSLALSMKYLLELAQHLSTLQQKIKAQRDSNGEYGPTLVDQSLLEYSSNRSELVRPRLLDTVLGPKAVRNRYLHRRQREQRELQHHQYQQRQQQHRLLGQNQEQLSEEDEDEGGPLLPEPGSLSPVKERNDFSALLGLEMELFDSLTRALPEKAGSFMASIDTATYKELAIGICNIVENFEPLGLPSSLASMAQDMLRAIIPSEEEESTMRRSVRPGRGY